MIVACDNKWWIGKKWWLPWKIKRDMNYFKSITLWTPDKTLIMWKKNAVIMWRKTWDSIPEKFRPLVWRINVVLSRGWKFSAPTANEKEETLSFMSLEDSLEKLSARDDIWEIFIIWGTQIYNYALENKLVDTIYITRVNWDHGCDSHINLDLIIEDFEKVMQGDELEEGDYIFRFNLLSRSKTW